MRISMTLRRLAALLPALSAGCIEGAPVGGGSSDAPGTSSGGTPTAGQSDTDTDSGDPPATGSSSSGATGTQGSGSTDANMEPNARDDYVRANAGEVLDVASADGLLGNDDDPDGDEILVNAAPESSWRGGIVDVAEDGSFRYTPPDDYGGCDGFSYDVTDARGSSATADVHISVDHPWQRPSPVQLDRVAQGWGGMAIDGEVPGDRSGRSVAIAGDVDGHGGPDVMIGAPVAAPEEPYTGRVYVAFGLLEGVGGEVADLVDDDTGFVVDGEVTDAATGNAVAGGGDINGDGRADLVIGAFKTNLGGGPMGDVAGRTFVVFGKDDGELINLADVTAGWGGFAITGAMMADFSGTDVDGGGDVNGDGLDDVIVGAPFSDPNGAESGRAYVVFGKSSGTPVALADIEVGVGGFAIEGEAEQDFAGNAVANAGDFNGDGFADIVVGAGRAEQNQGRVYLVFGKPGTDPVDLRDVAEGVGGFMLGGESMGDRAGWSVSGVGDVNGDGLSDIAFGAYGADELRGRTYVVFGRDDGVAPELSDLLLDAGLVIEGEAAGDFSGAALSTAGDINGDGLADIAIGAWRATRAIAFAGRAYVVFGRAEAGRVELSEVGAGMGGFAIEGEDPSSFAGRALAGGGDLDGDGVDDLVVGAYGAADYAGRTYVVHGGALACPD